MKSFLRKIRHKIIARRLEIPSNAAVLDTSCQDGGFLKILLEENPGKNIRAYGVDMNEVDIARAQNIMPEGSFKITDNNSLPFADKTFDIVISSLTLHHMAHPLDSIKEMRRVVKDGGSIYLIDLMAESRPFDFILKHIKCPEPYHFEKFYSFREVADLISKTQLNIQAKNKVIVFPTLTLFTQLTIVKLK